MLKENTVLRCLISGIFFTGCHDGSSDTWETNVDDLLVVIDIKQVCRDWRAKEFTFYVLHPVHGVGHAHFANEEQVFAWLEVVK